MRAEPEDFADALAAAWRGGELVDGRAWSAPPSLEAAEAIQDAVVAQMGTIKGWKLGATLPSVRATLGLSRPFFGALDNARVLFGDTVVGPWSGSVGVESEYAFRFGQDLAPVGTPLCASEVASALESIHSAIEIPGCRLSAGLGADGGTMLVADNGAAGWLVLGAGRPLDDAPDLLHAVVRLEAGGRELARGTAAAMGDPIGILTEFVGAAHARGYTIRAGQFVVTGSCTGYTQVPLGVPIAAKFEGLGRVEATFVGERR